MSVARARRGPAACWQAVLLVLIVAACSELIFALWPSLDLSVSSLFYDRPTGFALAGSRFWDGVLEANKAASLAFFVTALVLLPVSLFRCKDACVTKARYWSLVILLYLLGPGVLVNGLMKHLFGRARPVQNVLFGGNGSFTQAWEVSDYCHASCSFVSGEVSAATALFIGLVIGASWFAGTPAARTFRGLAWASVGLLLLTALQRMGSGRHFPSDVVFAALPIAALGLGLSCLLRPGPSAFPSIRLAGPRP